MRGCINKFCEATSALIDWSSVTIYNMSQGLQRLYMIDEHKVL